MPIETVTRVHAGNISRWFEELCRIRYSRVRALVQAHGRALLPKQLQEHGGVYCFWWTGSVVDLQSEHCCRTLTLGGPNQRPVSVEFDDDWFGLSAGTPIPLYVGKTAGRISTRVSQHLLLTKNRSIPTFIGTVKQRRPTTSCQLRAGIDQLFPAREDTRATVLDNIGLSFVALQGDTHAANRFYLEDLAVGMMRPALNIDVER